jgi:hypothetical protein
MALETPTPGGPRPWGDIPVVVITGVVLGLMVIWIAIRFMSRKK